MAAQCQNDPASQPVRDCGCPCHANAMPLQTAAARPAVTRLAAPLLLASMLGAAALPASAAEWSVSGFGTLGYARSDRPYTYQRFIDDDGTFDRDSVIGLQADAKFGNEFGATVQVKGAPSSRSDDRYAATLAWAFVSYRPSNDWLLRAGKQRIPIYLYSANYDVGATYDFARLPTEMYSISPSNDFVGVSAVKSWALVGSELSLDAYWGKSNAHFRFWLRDDIAGVQRAGPLFVAIEVEAASLALSLKHNDDSYRLGIGRAVLSQPHGRVFVRTYPFVALAPGVGYFQVSPSLPGPGIPTVDRFTFNLINVGAEVALGSGWRVVGEAARSFVPDMDISAASTRGYAALLKRAGPWTPYASYAFLRSSRRPLELYRQVSNSAVPAAVPGAAAINAAQRAGADGLIVYDQSSVAVGTSYSFSATSKLKAEVMRTRIGEGSSLVDAPPGGSVRQQAIHVLSLSYSVVF